VLGHLAERPVRQAEAAADHIDPAAQHHACGVEGIADEGEPAMRELNSVAYYNDGDWVESCTALVEHFDGTMEILHWPEEVARRKASAQAEAMAGPVARAA
jgi:hypothetical protein